MSTLVPIARDATWPERVATFMVFLSLGIGTGAWAAVLPAIQAGLSLTDRELSLALLAFAAGSILATILTGLSASWLMTGRSTGIVGLVWAATFTLPPLMGSLPGLMAATFAIGLTGGFVDVSVNGHAGQIEERWGSPIMSSFHGAFSLGGLAGAAFGGSLAAAGAGSFGQLWIPLAFAGLLDLLALPFIGLGTLPKPEKRAGGPGWGLTLAPGSVGRTLLLLGLIAVFSFVIEGAMADWSAIFLATVGHSSVAVSATGYAAFAVAMAAGRFAGDAIVARFGAQRVLMGGAAISAAGLAAAVAVPTPVVAAAGFAAVGIGLSNVVPILFSAAGRTASTPSAGIAPVASLGYAGFLVGPPIIGFLASWQGLRFALACLAPVAVLTVLFGRVAIEPQSKGRRNRI